MNKETVLKELEKVFSEVNVNTEYETAEENGLVNMLVTEFNDMGKNGNEILGEMFFMPQTIRDPRYEDFTVSLTITNEYDGTNLDVLLFALNYINFNMPMGSFVLDETGKAIMLKHIFPVNPDADDAETVEKINYVVSKTLSCTALWMDTIFDVMSGKAGMEEVIKVISEA